MLAREILRLLHLSDPYAVKETTLLAEVRQALGTVGDGEFRAALQRIQTAGYAIADLEPLTDDRRWQLTPAGRSATKGR